MEIIPEVNERNTQNGGTTPAVVISGLENVSEPLSAFYCKLPMQEQGYFEGQTNVTTDFPLAILVFPFCMNSTIILL